MANRPLVSTSFTESFELSVHFMSRLCCQEDLCVVCGEYTRSSVRSVGFCSGVTSGLAKNLCR